jgi:PQQ-like domain
MRQNTVSPVHRVMVACALAALALAGCGGGGGGGGSGPASAPPPAPAALTFSPTSATVSSPAGTATAISITATPAAGLSGTLYVKITDSPSVLSPNVTFTAAAGGTYSLSIENSAALAQGSYAGNLSVEVCSDAACTQPVAGSPVLLPFSFTITQPPPAQVFAPTPAALNATFTAGLPPNFSVTLTPSPQFTAALFLSLSPANIMQPGATITANSGGTYTVNMTPLASLTPSHLTGTLALNLCLDAGCTTLAPGSPVNLTYNLTIIPPPPALTLSPSTLTGSFVAGSPFPFNIVVQATPSPDVSAPLYVTVNDTTGTFSSSASFGYLNPNTPYQLLQVQALSTLSAGNHSGNFSLNVCSDSACTKPVLGSPITVPFNITIAPTPANAGLTPLVPWSGVPGWATYQGNTSHTGFVPVSLDPTMFAYRWVWQTPSTASNAGALSTLTVAAGQVYVDSGSVLYALKEFDKSILWSHDFSNIIYTQGFPAALNPPAVSGASVYVATSAQTATYMFGLAANDGTQLFQTAFGAQWEHYLAPTIRNSVVYTDGGEYGGMYAFDGTSGAQDFFASEQQYDEWTPAVDANYAYAYTGGFLTWVNNTTGVAVGTITDPTFQWAGYSIHGAPVLGAANSVIMVNVGNTNANSLVDFNTSTSTVTWSSTGPYGGNPGYAGGVIYATNKTPMRLEAHAEADGALQWSWSPPTSAETSYVGDVLVTNNLVFLSTNTTIYAIDITTHKSVWSIPTSGFLALSENGVLYVVESVNSATTGKIYAINVK